MYFPSLSLQKTFSSLILTFRWQTKATQSVCVVDCYFHLRQVRKVFSDNVNRIAAKVPL